ncbi:MAG: porin family protein [Bacteroidales bacterium]
MRTKITLVLLFSMVTYAANAQFPPYYFGLKAAPQISWMKPDADNYTGNGSKIGFAWGFIAEFNFTENHSIATGFNMLFDGGKMKFPDVIDSDSGTMAREYSLKYVEIPFTLKMRTNSINGMRYFGRIGLGSAFKIGSKKEDEFTPTIGSSQTFPKSNYTETAIWRESLIVGVGGEYEMKEGPKMGLELTFNNGFTNTLKDNDKKSTLNFFELAFSVLF